MEEFFKISVIVPVYNTAAYLPRCLDSILSNSYHNLEIICINDGSTDNSLEVLEEYARNDNRLIVINQPNAGVSVARNTGLEMATGELISFVDADDWIHPQYFEILVYFYERSSADIVICGYREVYGAEVETEHFDLAAIETTSMGGVETLKHGNLKRSIWGRVYYRDIIQNARFEKGILFGEDLLFNIGILCNSWKVELVKANLYYYFQRETSAVHVISIENRLTLLRRFMTNYEKSSDSTEKGILLDECIKNALYLRYQEKVERGTLNPDNYRELFAACREKLKECSFISGKRKLAYRCFMKFHPIYRLVMIRLDPTLLEWERRHKP